VHWALTGGQKYGPPLRFVPIPLPVLQRANKTLAKIKTG
jgi:hypothetical protein